VNLAIKLARKKNMSQMAYRLFKKAITKDPRYMLSYIELAMLYEANGKIKKAEPKMDLPSRYIHNLLG
jgi:Tfp pilus assembly protein PilF